MIPKSLSATSLQVAELCMDRWVHEYLDKAPGFSGVAANIGSACHRGLELYVQMVYIKKEAPPSWDLLKDLYQVGYVEVFGTANTDTDEFKDGLEMVMRWFKRTSFDGVEVLTVEVKETMDIPVLVDGEAQTIPFNYIIDRVDQLSETEFRVVDYKTVRVPIQPEDLHAKVQARTYALAIQRKYPEAQKIRVVFDLLRHDPVGIVVTREQNISFAHYLKDEAQRIVDTKRSEVKPTLNMECGYCVKAPTCEALRKHVEAGGLHSLHSDERVALKAQIEAQAKANKVVLEKLEELILREAAERDELEWVTNDGANKVEITLSRRRQVDASQVAAIIGPERFSQLGSITLGVLDTVMKDPSLSEEQVQKLKDLIYYKTGDPKAKIKPVTKLSV